MSLQADLPREKLRSKGAAALSDTELLQAVIGSGGKGNDFKKIARSLSATINRLGTDSLTLDDVLSIKGIGVAKATVICAALEFWRRRLIKQTAPMIDNAEKVAQQLDYIKSKKQEYFVLLTLDGSRRLINNRVITIGTLMASLVHPREVFCHAIEDRAASIIVAHNHPSGALDVSDNDREVTNRLRQAGDIIGIRLDDHIIVAGDEFVSAF